VIVLPEMFTTGFAMEAATRSLSQEEVVSWMREKAQQTNALIAGSAALQTDRGAVNRFLLVEPQGEVHFYDKRHLFRMADEHHHYQPGETRVIFEWRGWRIMPLVCYDLRFPVWSRNRDEYDLLENFPNRLVAGMLSFVIFPTGRHYRAPSDRLDHKVAKILQTPNATRSRIGRGQYLTPSEHNPVGLLEEALVDVMAADPIHQRICKSLGKNLPFTRLDDLANQALASGLINQDEAALLIKAEASRLRTINVDDFEPDALATQPVIHTPEKLRKPEAA